MVSHKVGNHTGGPGNLLLIWVPDHKAASMVYAERLYSQLLFYILWPIMHNILQSILFLYSFAKAVFLMGSILSVSFWQLWEFLNNWWRPWVTEFLGMGTWTKKAWFVVSAPSRQQGSKMAKYYRGPQRVLQKSLFFGTPRGEGQKKYKDGRQNPPSLDEIARKMCVRLSSITIKQQRLRAH